MPSPYAASSVAPTIGRPDVAAIVRIAPRMGPEQKPASP